MGTPDPPTAVELFLPAHISRPGPACGRGERSSQNTLSGKYNPDCNYSSADSLCASSVPAADSLPRDDQPADQHLRDIITEVGQPLLAIPHSASPGRTSHSSMVALDPPSSALPNASTSNLQLTRSCHLSRPDSESSAGVRAYQVAAHGKYFSFYDVTRPDAVPTSRLAPADPASQILLYYQNTGGINMSIADYQLACNDACYDIYAFTETWLNNNSITSTFQRNVFRLPAEPFSSQQQQEQWWWSSPSCSLQLQISSIETS